MLSDKLFDLARMIGEQAEATCNDPDCRAYETDFLAIQQEVLILAEEAKADELQQLADDSNEECRNGI